MSRSTKSKGHKWILSRDCPGTPFKPNVDVAACYGRHRHHDCRHRRHRRRLRRYTHDRTSDSCASTK